MKLGDGQSAIVTDTVGFIHKLPHQLVEAFRATLEEVTRADVLIEVVDASDPHAPEHRATVQQVLDELGAGDKPRLVVYNKVDLVEGAARDGAIAAPIVGGAVFVSASHGLRDRRAARPSCPTVLASLWVDVDAPCRIPPGSCWPGSVSGRRSTCNTGERDVRVVGRMAPAMAGEVEAVAERYAANGADLTAASSRNGSAPYDS